MIVEEAKRRVKERVTAWDPMARNFDVLRSSPYLLTEREVDIAKLVFEGGSYKEIARTLGISHRTVETHSVRARDKIGARTKTEMVRMIADLL
jgi:DNA-binding NarL/FixJ family response regulator